MRVRWVVAAFFLLVLAVGALPVVEAQTATKLYLPMVPRDPTPTPSPTATPQPAQDVHVRYRAYVQDRGWLDWQGEGGQAGTTGESRRIEGIQAEITSGPPGATIRYRTQVQDVGWTNWVTNGQQTEQTGTGRQVEAIQIGLENIPAGSAYLHTESYAADWAWLGYVRDFWISGTVGQGRRLEAFHMYVTKDRPEPAQIKVAYNANVRGQGYTGWQRNGDLAGTTGQSKPLNTFKAVLYNNPDNMKIEYRCYVQDNDWQGWTDGECGIFSADKDIYSTEMRLVNAYPGTVLSYRAHIANRGDVSYSSDSPGSNPVVGDPNQKFRFEAVGIGLGAQQP
jgi:uncharacterized protein YjdB